MTHKKRNRTPQPKGGVHGWRWRRLLGANPLAAERGPAAPPLGRAAPTASATPINPIPSARPHLKDLPHD